MAAPPSSRRSGPARSTPGPRGVGGRRRRSTLIEGAGGSERCRTRAVGRRPQPLASLPPAQLADHLRVKRQLKGRQTLGRREPSGGARAGTVMVTATAAPRASTQQSRPGASLSGARLHVGRALSRRARARAAGVGGRRAPPRRPPCPARARAHGPARRGPPRPRGAGPRRDGPTDVEGRMRPQRSTDRLSVVDVTSRWPASALMSRSVAVSAMPGSTTVVPKSERNPSAAGPHRPPRLGEVLQAGQDQEALPAALADHGGQVGDRRDVGHLVEREERGRPGVPSARPVVGGVSHVTDGRDDERRELALPPSRRAEIEGVRAAQNVSKSKRWDAVDAIAASVRYAASTPDAVDQIPDCSRESVATMPGEQIGRRSVLARAVRRGSRGRGPVVAIDPSQDVVHRQFFRAAAAWRRVESNAPARSVQWCSARPYARRPAGTDHRVGRHHRGVPIARGRQW